MNWQADDGSTVTDSERYEANAACWQLALSTVEQCVLLAVAEVDLNPNDIQAQLSLKTRLDARQAVQEQITDLLDAAHAERGDHGA